MKVSSTLQIRLSEVREKLNGLAGEPEALTEEQRATADALHVEYADLEVKFRAAMVSESDAETRAKELFSDDPQAVEYRALVGRASVGRIFKAALEHRQTEGAESELQKHRGLAANQIPLALLQERAATPAPTNVGTMQQPVVPWVFPGAVSAFLGVSQPVVPVGEVIFPVMSSELSVEAPAEGASTTETTGSFTADALQPARLQASFFFSREDRARFQNLDSALRLNLSEGLMDGLDGQVITGTNGLLSGTNLPNHNVTAETTYALYRSQFAFGRVDGRYAGQVGDVRIVMGSDTYGHAAAQFRSANAGDRAALEDLVDATGGVRVTSHVPAAASNRQNNIIRLGASPAMVSPIWEGVTLIPDEVTKASNGQIVVTAVLLFAIKILRAAGFYKQMAQIA